jgi:opacity protein-like surface antigen
VGYVYGIGIEVANVINNVDVFVDYRKHEVDMAYIGQRVDFDPATIQVGLNYHF